MLNSAFSLALTLVLLGAPVLCQSAYDSTAATGESGAAHRSAPTNTQYGQEDNPWGDNSAKAGPLANPGPGVSGPTRPQGGFRTPLNLPPVVTAMPEPGSKTARGSLALQNEGLTELQQTSTAILSNGEGGAVAGAEKVVGNEGAYINGYKKENTLNNLLSPGLSTGHQDAAPPLTDGY